MGLHHKCPSFFSPNKCVAWSSDCAAFCKEKEEKGTAACDPYLSRQENLSVFSGNITLLSFPKTRDTGFINQRLFCYCCWLSFSSAQFVKRSFFFSYALLLNGETERGNLWSVFSTHAFVPKRRGRRRQGVKSVTLFPPFYGAINRRWTRERVKVFLESLLASSKNCGKVAPDRRTLVNVGRSTPCSCFHSIVERHSLMMKGKVNNFWLHPCRLKYFKPRQNL